MYVDPTGEIGLLAFVVTLLVFAIIATTPANKRPGENVTVSGYASPDPFAVGGEVLGFGMNAQYVPDGETCNVYGECIDFSSSTIQLGSYGLTYSSTSSSENISVSVSILFFTFDLNRPFDVSSWGGGISFSVSGGLPYVGSGSFSYDVDFIGLFRDQFGG